MNEIQDDLELHKIAEQSDITDPSEVPAEDLQNLTAEQSAQIIESNKDLKSEV